jgi:DNA-binding XRE family transcriptional regulator
LKYVVRHEDATWEIGDKIFAEGIIASGQMTTGERDGGGIRYYLVTFPHLETPVPIVQRSIRTARITPRFRYRAIDYTTLRDVLAKNIRNLRHKKNISQADLARLCGVGQTTVSQWETGTCDPTVGNLYNLAGIFKIEMGTFFEE